MSSAVVAAAGDAVVPMSAHTMNDTGSVLLDGRVWNCDTNDQPSISLPYW